MRESRRVIQIYSKQPRQIKVQSRPDSLKRQWLHSCCTVSLLLILPFTESGSRKPTLVPSKMQDVFIFLRKCLLSFCSQHLDTSNSNPSLLAGSPDWRSVRRAPESTATISGAGSCQTPALRLFTQKHRYAAPISATSHLNRTRVWIWDAAA